VNGSRRPPTALTIAGSDSGGGAGIQADLKTFAAWGVYGTSAITAVTAQNTVGVRGVEILSAEIVAAQIDAVAEDIGWDAVKIGMLADAAITRVVADHMRRGADAPIVLDPVMVAKSGDVLLSEEARAVLASQLLPRVTLVTPNLPEAEVLLGRALDDLEARIDGARELAARGPAVLLKGGHAPGETVEDVVALGDEIEVIRHPRLTTSSTHGTGCTLSSAIAANLAWGHELADAIRQGLDYTMRAIAAAFPLGGGHGPVNHLVRTTHAEEA
jgi:hydroxymethylpyrimidine/phosphomethylpyrimidine kinase